MDEIARPRTTSSDLSRQVMVEGAWHRRLPDLSSTACGLAYPSQFCPLRSEMLVAPLCFICFTAVEIARADELQLKERENT